MLFSSLSSGPLRGTNTMSSIRFSPLTETFGVEAHDVDLSTLPDTEVMRELGLACVEHKVLLLRGQKPNPRGVRALCPRVG